MTLPPACPAVGHGAAGHFSALMACWADRFGTENRPRDHRGPIPRCGRDVEVDDELGLCKEHRCQFQGKLVDVAKLAAEDTDAITRAMEEAGILGMMPAVWLPVDVEED